MINHPPKLSGSEQQQIATLRQYIISLVKTINEQEERIVELEIEIGNGGK